MKQLSLGHGWRELRGQLRNLGRPGAPLVGGKAARFGYYKVLCRVENLVVDHFLRLTTALIYGR